MKISEMSARYGLTPDTLRYYERIGLLPPVQRDRRGLRDYSEVDIQRVEFIKCMRSAGLPIETLIAYVALVEQGEPTVAARRDILKEQRAQLAARLSDMQKTLDLLDYKIGLYDRMLCSQRKRKA